MAAPGDATRTLRASTADISELLGSALSLDDADKPWEAYRQYVRSIMAIANKMLSDAETSDGDPKALRATRPQKMLVLLKNSVDRAEGLLNSKLTVLDDRSQPQPAVQQDSVEPPSPRQFPAAPKSPSLSHQSSLGSVSQADAALTRVPSASAMGSSSAELASKSLSQPGTGTAGENGTSATVHAMYTLSPTRLAQAQNAALMRSYQKRLSTLEGAQRSALYLSLIRRCDQNLNAARAQERAIQANIAERRKRMAEERERQMQQSAHSTDVCAEKVPALAERVRDYESRHPLSLPAEIGPDDPTYPDALSLARLAFKEHPLSVSLAEFQYGIVTQSSRRGATAEDARAYLAEVVSAVHDFRRTATCVLAQARPPYLAAYVRSLDAQIAQLQAASPQCDQLARLQQQRKAALREKDPAWGQWCETLDSALFRPLAPILMRLYSMAGLERLQELNKRIAAFQSSSPAALGIKPLYCLGDTGDGEPYAEAGAILRQLPDMLTPFAKLECVAKAIRSIIAAATDYWAQRGKPDLLVGTDDLLPVLGFVILRTGMGSVLADSQFLAEFADESCSLGEEGYCLATLLCAVDYLCVAPLDARPFGDVQGATGGGDAISVGDDSGLDTSSIGSGVSLETQALEASAAADGASAVPVEVPK
eukprot:Opistho-1_new@23706